MCKKIYKGTLCVVSKKGLCKIVKALWCTVKLTPPVAHNICNILYLILCCKIFLKSTQLFILYPFKSTNLQGSRLSQKQRNAFIFPLKILPLPFPGSSALISWAQTWYLLIWGKESSMSPCWKSLKSTLDSHAVKLWSNRLKVSQSAANSLCPLQLPEYPWVLSFPLKPDPIQIDTGLTSWILYLMLRPIKASMPYDYFPSYPLSGNYGLVHHDPSVHQSSEGSCHILLLHILSKNTTSQCYSVNEKVIHDYNQVDHGGQIQEKEYPRWSLITSD